jgi:hypothetical protein
MSDDDIYEDIHYAVDSRDNNNTNNNNIIIIEDDDISDDNDDDDNVNNNNNDFLSQLKTLTTEDNDIYPITNYANNKHKNKNENKHKNKNKNKNEIFQPIYTKAQAIQYIIDNIKFEFKSNKNDENILKNKLSNKTLSNEKKIKYNHLLEFLKEKKIVLENDLKIINKLKNINIFDYRGRYILNDNSMIVGPLRFYTDVTPLINHEKYISINKMIDTYSVEKNNTFLTIHKNISYNNPIVYQLNFIILNLKNDSKLEIGIMAVNIYKNKNHKYITKGIHLDGTLSEYDGIHSKSYSLKEWEDSRPVGKKEVKKFNLYKPIPFKEKSIVTIQYNPKKTTVEYWCDKNKVKFISENYHSPYEFQFFVKFYNCSIRFLSFFFVSQKENLDKFISERIFLTKEVKEVEEKYEIPDGLKGVDKSVLLNLLNKDKYGFYTDQLIGIDKSFVPLKNDPNFERKIFLNNYFADVDIDYEAFIDSL